MTTKLLVDEYRPTSFEKFNYHKEEAGRLKALAKENDFPHLMLYGPSGAGKKTMAMAFLREVYGSTVDRLKFEHMEMKAPSGAKVDIRAIASNYHIDITPSNAGIHDRVVIQEVIKGLASTNQIYSGDEARRFKVVVMNEVDNLTKDAQHALRRTMEKYVSTCRLILICNSTSKVIPAIRSRCLSIRVAGPSHDEMALMMRHVSTKERFVLPESISDKICELSDRNMRRALITLEACHTIKNPMTDDMEVPELEWKEFIRSLARILLLDCNHERLIKIREMLYELQVHLIPAQLILETLVFEINRNVPGTLKSYVVKMAAAIEHRMQRGSKTIFHLESFCISFMALHQHYNEKFSVDDFDFSSDMDMD